MKKLNQVIILLYFFVFSNFVFSQGAEHKIVELLSDENVRINIGQDSGVKTGDYFQVFGKSEVIHPATGQLMVKENVYIGKLEVIKVEQTESICKIIEQKKYFQVSDKVRKVSKNVDSVIQEEKQTQFEFESPSKREYAETIYSKKPDPTRDISAKKLWFDGPFLLEKGMVKFNFDFDSELEAKTPPPFEDGEEIIFYDEYEFRLRIPFNISYGLSENVQIKIEIPLLMKRGLWNEDGHGIEGSNFGLSDIILTGLYPLSNQDYNISLGALYSLATDDGWRKLKRELETDLDEGQWRDYKLPLSNGYNIFSILGSIGIKKKNLLAFGELKYNFNGKREDYEEIINYRNDNEIVYIDTTLYQYDPTNNFEINFVGSFFISERTKLRSEINILNNYSPINEDSDSEKSDMILLKPSIHKLMTESFVWSFGFSFPLKKHSDHKYFGLNMGFSWIN